MNKLLLIIVVILSIISLVISSTDHSTTYFNNEKNIKVKKDDKVENLELEEYIVGVVASEMPASFNIEALKAQAIASRTYAMYKINQSNKNYDVIASVSNQGYITISEMKKKWGNEFDKYYTKIKEAVSKTSNMVMKYNDEIIEAYYFAMSNGYTEDVSLVFSEERDYLVSVESIYDNESLNNFMVETIFNKKDFCIKLSINCENINITNIERSSTNRVNNITINNKVFKGTEIRQLLNLRSTDFTISLYENDLKIVTYGYGHGVGMSQYGANGMANDGYTYDEILKYYYKDIKISKI